jgi:hypothetical protein
MTCQFAIVAQGVSIDRLTDRLTIFNIFERIASPRFPILVPEISFVTVLRREAVEPEVFDAVITIQLGQNVIGQANMHVDFQGQLMNRNISNFQTLPILTAGDLQFSFALPNGTPVRATVPVIQLPA